ncbi:aminopeptidase N [Drosophila persimilis]|nr:aminopeptidase N [Drosophila persimilis]
MFDCMLSQFHCHSMLGSTSIYCLLLLLMPSASLAVYDHYRLPTALEPQHYDIRILTHLNASDLRFEGAVRIDLLVLQATRNITLHARNLRIDKSGISLTGGEERQCLSDMDIELNEVYDYYTLHLCRDLELGQTYQLTMHFESSLNATESGYYNSSYTDAASQEKHYLAVTQFSPTFARQAFPCFDEPPWKATFNVTLGYHKRYTGLSNMPIRQCRKHESLLDYVWCEHEQLSRTSTYLVAFAVHDLTNAATVQSDTKNRVIFRNWLQPKAVDQANFSIAMAPRVIGYFEDLFRVDFPLRKIDQLAAPTHRFSAMENWGLVTFKEAKFVHSPKDLQAARDGKAKTLAHEYAHQWFGNLVTMKWWNDLWLKEGPSTYFAYLALDALQPDWCCGERFIGEDLERFFLQDSASSARAISREVKDPAQILGQFSEYVYEKGALIMRMLHKMIGEEAFLLAIRSYLSVHSFGNVEQAHLWQSMQAAAVEEKVLHPDFNLGRAMDSWTLQGGYPLVTAVRDYETGSVSLNQTRFYLEKGLREGAATGNCWWVPLSLVSQNDPDFERTRPQSWLECPTSAHTVELPLSTALNEWFILNPQVSVIYRVNYDEHNWRMIISTLANDPSFGGIPGYNRVQLMDDLMALGAVKLLSYDWAFDLFEYLQREEEFLPWKRSLGLLDRLGMLLSGRQATEFKVYMAKLLTAPYSRLPKLGAITSMSSTNREVSLMRLIYAQACRYRVDDCVAQARQAFLRDSNGFLELPADLQEVAYCTAIEQGGEANFQHVMQLFRNSTNAPQQGIYASALGCSRNISLLGEFLDYTLQSEKEEVSDCYMLTVKTALTRENVAIEAADHILSHAKRLTEKFKKRQLTSLLQTLAGNLHRPEDSARLKEQLKDLKQFEEPLQKALDMVKVNQQWQRDCSGDFSQALGRHI